jgi:hypothetical protein
MPERFTFILLLQQVLTYDEAAPRDELTTIGYRPSFEKAALVRIVLQGREK